MYRVELSEDEINVLLRIVTEQKLKLSEMSSYYNRKFVEGFISRERLVAEQEEIVHTAKMLNGIEHALCVG